MGKCVDDVYFMEKWSKLQGLKIAISQQFSYVNFSMIIFSLSVGIIDTQMHIRSALPHVNCFVCFFIYYMCDGLIASIASSIISLVTGKNQYENNALMKKAAVIFKQKI